MPTDRPPSRLTVEAKRLFAGLDGAMWAIVHFAIWPSLKIVLGETAADADARDGARKALARFARINLVLSLPVTFAMVAAAHLA